MGIILLIGLAGITYWKNDTETTNTSQKVTTDSNNLLGVRSRTRDWVFNIVSNATFLSEVLFQSPVGFEDTITAQDINVTSVTFGEEGTLNNLLGIDAVSATTLEDSLSLGGQLSGVSLTNATINANVVGDLQLAPDIDYTGVFNILGSLLLNDDGGEDGEVLTSDGNGVPFWDVPALPDSTLNGLEANQFLRSDTSDAFTSGVLSFNAGTLLNLSAINHSSTAVQGLRLPQNTSFSNPSSGEGYLAWNSNLDRVLVFNGSSWVGIDDNGSASLQTAYTYGNSIELSSTYGDITISNAADNILFLDESSGYIGIGNITPTQLLSIGSTGQTTFNTAGNLVFSNGGLLDLSAVTHANTATQGLRLPTTDGSQGPASNDGYIAWDTLNDRVVTWNGSIWSNVSGASTTLQQSYTAGNTIQLSAGNGDLRIYNDGGDELLFFDESSGFMGIGTTAPSYALDVNGDISVASGSDLYIGTIGLTDTATPTTSGAYLIGVNDEFDYSTNTNVQAVLNDLDLSLGTLTGTSHPAASLTTNGLGFVTLDATTQAFELNAVDLTSSDITGALGVSNGGTGATTFTSNGVLYGNGTSALQATAGPAPGQLLVGLGSSAPGFVTMSGDATIDENGVLSLTDSYDNPLTFNNGLTRSSDVITLGGTITQDTRLFDATYEYLFLDNSTGFLGIGTTAPQALLHVSGGDILLDNNRRYQGYNHDGDIVDIAYIDTDYFVQLAHASNTQGWILGSANRSQIVGNSNSAITFNINTAEIARMTIGGRLGLGTTNPQSMLSVGPSSQFRVSSTGDLARINNVGYTFPSSQAGGSNYILSNNGSGVLSWSAIGTIGGVSGTGTANYIPVFNSTSNVVDSILYQTSNSIGVGTTNPQNTMHLYTPNTNQIGYRVENTSGEWSYAINSSGSMIFTKTGTSGAELGLTADGVSYTTAALTLGNGITLRSSGVSSFMGGNLGIGTTNPASALSVVGSATVSSNVTVGGQVLIADGSTGAPGLALASNPDTGLQMSGSVLRLITDGSIRIGLSSSHAQYIVPIRGVSGSTAAAPAYAFDDDSNSGLFLISDGILGISSNGSERMRINNATVPTIDFTGSLEFTMVITGDTTIGVCKDTADGTSDNIELRECSGTPSDIAEFYAAEAGLKPGDVVELDYIDSTPTLVKAKSLYSSKSLGVVSTYGVGQFGKPLGHSSIPENQNPTAIGLSGKVPVIVSNSNGNIQAGDPITTSDIPGVAVKATAAGKIIGYALEPFDGSTKVSSGVRQQEDYRNSNIAKFNADPTDPTAEDQGKILLFINLSWHQPNITESLDFQAQIDSAVKAILGLSDEHLEGLAEIELPDNVALEELVSETTLATLQEVFADGDITIGGDLRINGTITADKVKTKELEFTDNRFIGTAKIKEGDSSIKVDLSDIKESSKVFITPRTNLEDATLYVKKIEENEYFEVGLTKDLDFEVKFDWWVIQFDEAEEDNAGGSNEGSDSDNTTDVSGESDENNSAENSYSGEAE